MKKIIRRPVITEKSMQQVETENKYTFLVDPAASKIEIIKAIQDTFDVTVLSVNTLIRSGKRVEFGRKRVPGSRTDEKKVVVTLKSGDSIKDFNLE